MKLVMEDFDEAVRLLPNHAAIYLTRGGIYHEVGNHDRAIEDYDNAVRRCPNYADDFVDHKFTRMGYDLKSAVEKAIELLNNEISNFSDSDTDYYYYTGVQSLFRNDGLSAETAFQIALDLGCDGPDKIHQHLENLKNRK